MVENLVMPLSAGVILSIKDVGAGNFPFRAVSGNDVIAPVAVEIADADFVAFGEFVENDSALPPARFFLRVDNDLVSVPR